VGGFYEDIGAKNAEIYQRYNSQGVENEIKN